MTAIEKWAERVYSETDFGRSVGTSLAGALGLGIYLKFGDWVIAAFASVIFFPLARLTAAAVHACHAPLETEGRNREYRTRLQQPKR